MLRCQGTLGLFAACLAPVLAHADAIDDALRRRELSVEDGRLNAVYSEIIDSVPAEQRTEVRSAQRDWLRWRDDECKSVGISGPREAWLDAVTADFGIWNCVHAATIARRSELRRELDALRDPVYPSRIDPRSRNEKWVPIRRSSGRWYFEVTVDRGKVARVHPTDLQLGFVYDNVLAGIIQPVHDNETGVSVYGLAIDIDSGRTYQHIGGVWQGAVPGSTAGMSVPTKKSFRAVASTRDAQSLLLLENALVPNFGDEPFVHPLPQGYKAWRDVMCDEPQNKREMGVCFGKDLRDADQAMNAAYDKSIYALDAAGRDELRAAQRSWVVRRDGSCSAGDSNGDREIWYRSVLENREIAICVTSLTRARTEELRALPARTVLINRALQRPPPVTEPSGCFPGLQLPERFMVLATGEYGGRKIGFQIDQSGAEATRIDVQVNEPSTPVVLLLAAYEPTVWTISWSTATRIVAVLASGYHKQAVAGLDPSVPLLVSTYDNRGPCGYFDDARATSNVTALRAFGRDVDGIYSSVGGAALVGSPLAEDDHWVTSSAVSPESFYDRNAPRAGSAGLEDAVRRGVLRSATNADLLTWAEALAAAGRPTQTGVLRAPVVLLRAYVVLGPFAYPAGLYGAQAATFFIPRGVPKPTGTLGHSRAYDFETLSCNGPACL